jgi:hypothetical protein
MLFQNGSISGSMATKEDARQPGNPGTLNKNCLNSGPRCHMHNIIHVLRSIKCIHFFLNHRPFLKFPERQKHCIPCCFLIIWVRMLFQLLAAFDAGPGDGLPLIRHLFVRKTQI